MKHINVNILEKLNEIYRLKHMIRYNNIPRIKDESVAEHSYFVALIVAELNKKYKFNLEKALLMAIVHDIVEIYISDIPRNVKHKFKELDTLLTKIESSVVLEKFPEYSVLLSELSKQKTTESKIVKLADTFSVLQYSNTEIALGSTYYMPSVKKAAQKGINILEKKLERYKK